MARSRVPAERTLYHFTSTYHLERIRADGVIRPSESNVSRYQQHAGPDVVWLLDSPDLDGKSHGLWGAGVDKTAVRFTVRARAVRWVKWTPAKRMDSEFRIVFVNAAGGHAASNRWWVSERPIPESEWLAVDVLH